MHVLFIYMIGVGVCVEVKRSVFAQKKIMCVCEDDQKRL